MLIQPLYFAYGSNMLLKRITERVGKVKHKGTYFLKDYKLVFNCGNRVCSYANIMPVKGKGMIVEGVLYELTDNQISELDRYECYPYNYQKIWFRDGDKVIFAYQSSSEFFRSSELPESFYLKVLKSGALENELFRTYNWLVKYEKKTCRKIRKMGKKRNFFLMIYLLKKKQELQQ